MDVYLHPCMLRDPSAHKDINEISLALLLDIPELLLPANMVGLTEDLPSLLDTTGGPGVPSHSWAFPGSLEEAVPWWPPLSLFSSFGSGSVLWLLIFSSSSGSTKHTNAHFVIKCLLITHIIQQSFTQYSIYTNHNSFKGTLHHDFTV